MKEVYNFAIIGCGWIAESKHIPGITAQPDAKIAALCDIKEEKAHSLNEKFKVGARIYQDYRELLKNPEIDIVHVATPNPTHCEITTAALEAGKHVLVEKPMACTKAECRQMMEAAHKAGKKMTVGFNWRLRPQTLYLKEMCENGELGEIYFAKAHSARYRDVPYWGELINGNNGGGVLIDGAPHSLDLVLWLLDNYEPLSVKAHTYNKMKGESDGNSWGPWPEEEFKVEDSGFALITMKNGVTIFLEAAWLIHMISGDNMCTLCGTKGGADMFGDSGLRLNGVRHGRRYVTEPCMKDSPAPFTVQTMPCEIAESRVWLDAIKNDTEVFVKPEQAMVVTQIVEAVYQSAETGKEVFFEDE